MWESGRSPDFRRKNKPIGVHGSCESGGGVSLSFANDVSEGWLDLLRCNTGSGDFLIMRRANAQLGSIRRAAIVVAQCGCVRARPTKIDAPVVPLVSENSR